MNLPQHVRNYARAGRGCGVAIGTAKRIMEDIEADLIAAYPKLQTPNKSKELKKRAQAQFKLLETFFEHLRDIDQELEFGRRLERRRGQERKSTRSEKDNFYNLD